MTASLLAALLIGFSSSAHCIFMCGGIAASLTATDNASGYSDWFLTALFHTGRLLSYAIIGFMLGFAVHSVNSLIDIGLWLRMAAGVLLIAMGLYLANIWRFLRHLERLMEPVWRPVSVYLKQYIPARKPKDALITGLFWGWLPCGLVYSTLAWAATSGNPAEAALLMFAMGVGSLPALLGIGMFSQYLRKRWTTTLSAIALCLFGLWTLSMPLMSILPFAEDHSVHMH